MLQSIRHHISRIYMDEILLLPAIRTYSFGPDEINKYLTEHFCKHPYLDTALPHPTKEGVFLHHYIDIAFYLNKQKRANNINIDIFFHNIEEWHDQSINSSTFFPFSVYIDDMMIDTPVYFTATKNFISWRVEPHDKKTQEILNKTQVTFCKTQYKRHISRTFDNILQMSEKFNIPEKSLFIGEITVDELRKDLNMRNKT